MLKMTELTDRLGEPTEVTPFVDCLVGATTTLFEPQKLVVASYGMAEFWIYNINFSPNNSIPELNVETIIGNSPKVTWLDGGKHAWMWEEKQPRAQVAQLVNDGKSLFYMANGQRSVGRLELNPEKVMPELKEIKSERGEYFLQLRDGRIAVIEQYDDCILRIYDIIDENELKLSAEKQLSGSLFYGLCQDNNDELMMIVPEQGSYPLASTTEPGMYRVSLTDQSIGELRRDERFDQISMPTDVRGLAPGLSNSEVQGFFMTTYGYNRNRIDGGEPSEIFYVPLVKEK